MSNALHPAQGKRGREADQRAEEIAHHDELRDAKSVSYAVTDVLRALQCVPGALVEIESRKFDSRTQDLIDLVRDAQALFDKLAVELAEHVCEHVETNYPIRDVA